ncbi:hypothetical protein F8M41_005750 [Gigaspora margarita]|uniref:Uncharacterized protein n=1 Tax=Gigaspora margarita TaxID=4874 RepID=A0A8H4AX51_GIGMA|nr:hypothetical protein F8M41_005750 [Gigaspora margarita]
MINVYSEDWLEKVVLYEVTEEIGSLRIKMQLMNKLHIAKEIVRNFMYLHNILNLFLSTIICFGLAEQINETSITLNSTIYGTHLCFINPKYKLNKKYNIYNFGVIFKCLGIRYHYFICALQKTRELFSLHKKFEESMFLQGFPINIFSPLEPI